MRGVVLRHALEVIIVTTFLLLASGVSAEPPRVIDELIGTWEGKGALFGSSASFRMTWERVLDDKFVRLTFQNAMEGSDGSRRVLDAVAFYRLSDDERITGTWFDSRGMVLPLDASADDSTLTTMWGSDETERGRTIYRLVDGGIEVSDFVLKADGEWREFGQATYRRAGDQASD